MSVCVFLSLKVNHFVTDAWSRLSNKELFGLMDVVTMTVDTHLPFGPCVVYGESSLVLAVSCWLELFMLNLHSCFR